MKYRKFGKLDFQVSALGFGAMRLPVINGDQAEVDIPETLRLIRYAIDNGVNYLDTAYFYHMGASEKVIGMALQDGYRDKVKIATKMPCYQVEEAEDFDRIFHEQLDRLQTDRIDFYLLHSLNKAAWSKMRELKYLEWAEKKIAAGLIGYLGFSFHDTYPVFKEIIDDYSGWVLCQILYNYMDVDYQAGTRGLKYAADKGLAVAAMEPLRGGNLGKEPPGEVAELLDQASVKHSPVEWALLWVWEHPEVSVALSGMCTVQQISENLAIADRAGPGVLTTEDKALIDRVTWAYRKLGPVPCTGCRYCLPCPAGVEISRILSRYNDNVMYNDIQSARLFYDEQTGLKPEQKADNCTACLKCLQKCPQKILIPEQLKEAHKYFSSV